MQKLRRFLYTSLFIFMALLILSTPTAAQFFQSNLLDFVKTEGIISIPIFAPAEKIEIEAEADTTLSAADNEDLILKAGEKYFVSQNKIKISSENQTAAEASQTGWGIQIMASSTAEKAREFKTEAAGDIEAELTILAEDGMFKVLAGFYDQRSEAEKLQQDLKALGYNGWPREFETPAKKKEAKAETAEPEAAVETEKEAAADQDSAQPGLILYNQAGEKLREAYVFEIAGEFKANSKKMQGKFQFGPLANSVLFSYKTELEDLTAQLLQNYFSPEAPLEALKAQAVLYRTSILYQLETQGARLENLDQLEFNPVNPVFEKAAAATRSEVLIKDNEFYYNTDFSLQRINKPKTGTVALAQAEYNYQEIINYYYERSEIVNLYELIDSEEKLSARIEQGLYLKEIRQVSWAGPRLITVIDYNLDNDRLRLKPVLAQGIVPGREDLVDLIKKHKAIAGVNGGYFHYSGRPLGLLYINGELVSEPLYQRSSLLIDQNNNISFAQVDWQGELLIESPELKINIDGVNREAKKEEIIVFNYFYGPRMSALDKDHYDIVVRDNRILGIENKEGVQTAIPPDGFIIRFSAQRSDIKNRIPELKDKKITLNYNFSPNLTEKNILHAVGGGPRLLKDGRIDISGQEENFQNDILNGRSPRTAVALTEDNHLLLLTVDGRQSDLSVGMSLEELAQTLKDLGAVEAINLDGGGSARMVIRGFTMSSPSEKRLISNGVVVDHKNN
ncbi:MAG: phosphodiester glycosidase family protein [Bacillota bacterium]